MKDKGEAIRAEPSNEKMGEEIGLQDLIMQNMKENQKNFGEMKTEMNTTKADASKTRGVALTHREQHCYSGASAD